MRKLSAWARAHRWNARIIMILLHGLLVALALYIGHNLEDLSVQLAPPAFYLSMVLYLLSVVFYPDKKQKQRKNGRITFYFHQKTCDLFLALTGVFMICYIANSTSLTGTGYNILHGSSIDNAWSESNVKRGSVEPYKMSRTQRRALLKELRTELRKVFKAEKSRGAKIGLTILSIVLALALLLLVASISCNLSCNGNEGAATAVLIFGSAAVITLLVILIKKIYKDPEKNSRTDFQNGQPTRFA